ncbi:major histocompatibility complex class I-related gene protein-like [Clupea harengus]|uniref:Major histocompatibility complex class I-related gene protein-like n=1 Tax=Clupea harengus TaxID=7950 RepID=A0A6P8FI83_CLUHA|nr:major histocompatibility complex class I-related gene protein-like [Clupea harengus]
MKMTGICLVLYIVSVSYSMCSPGRGSHSLLYFSTYIKGDTPFPEFSAVLMLDDIPLAYYSLNEQKLLPRGPMNEEDMFHVADQKYAKLVFTSMHKSFRAQAQIFIKHYNNTYGIPSLQSIFGCNLLDHSAPGRIIYTESFNGENGDETLLSISDKIFLQSMHWRSTLLEVLDPFCIKALQKLLKINRKHVMRKVKPRVRLFQKAHPDSGGMKVTCLATGFYPRHINMTLFRDGQPLDSHQITGGELLPNGDGTYQMRKSLEVSTDDLKENYQYTCKAEHLSLDNKLDIPLDYEPYPDQKYVVAVVVIALVCVTDIIIGFCRTRCMANNRGLRIHQGRKKDMSTPATAEGGPDTPAQNGDEKRENEEEEEKGEEERSPP